MMTSWIERVAADLGGCRWVKKRSRRYSLAVEPWHVAVSADLTDLQFSARNLSMAEAHCGTEGQVGAQLVEGWLRGRGIDVFQDLDVSRASVAVYPWVNAWLAGEDALVEWFWEHKDDGDLVACLRWWLRSGASSEAQTVPIATQRWLDDLATRGAGMARLVGGIDRRLAYGPSAPKRFPDVPGWVFTIEGTWPLHVSAVDDEGRSVTVTGTNADVLFSECRRIATIRSTLGASSLGASSKPGT